MFACLTVEVHLKRHSHYIGKLQLQLYAGLYPILKSALWSNLFQLWSRMDATTPYSSDPSTLGQSVFVNCGKEKSKDIFRRQNTPTLGHKHTLDAWSKCLRPATVGECLSLCPPILYGRPFLVSEYAIIQSLKQFR